ncbi:MAG: transcriptional repressor NrdR [Firmicutes bacterium]|jgi:transcriptional repressor NrdR|nr:transcriptional repressor NrdR [Bacillota bacterium]HPU01343.1 transcriptional regulator NrdR [Bacillota bacterium]
MKCPYCGTQDSRVLDSRATQEGAAIRRRRECNNCGKRFTTMEKIEEEPLVVIKRDGRRELFDGSKVLRGLILAGRKRNIPLSTWQQLVENLEQELRSNYAREIASEEIGEYVLERLRQIDEVAYVRFASVYRQFPDIETFKRELEEMLRQRREGKPPQAGKKEEQDNG